MMRIEVDMQEIRAVDPKPSICPGIYSFLARGFQEVRFTC
jgi:hypothetical protein